MSVAHFTTSALIDGRYEVVDETTGRPVAVRETKASANGVAFDLNNAAKGGRQALAKALGGGRKFAH